MFERSELGGRNSWIFLGKHSVFFDIRSAFRPIMAGKQVFLLFSLNHRICRLPTWRLRKPLKRWRHCWLNSRSHFLIISCMIRVLRTPAMWISWLWAGWPLKLSAEIVPILDDRDPVVPVILTNMLCFRSTICLRSVTKTVKEAMLLASDLGLKTSKARGRECKGTQNWSEAWLSLLHVYLHVFWSALRGGHLVTLRGRGVAWCGVSS